jgi:hypothetical protein
MDICPRCMAKQRIAVKLAAVHDPSFSPGAGVSPRSSDHVARRQTRVEVTPTPYVTGPRRHVNEPKTDSARGNAHDVDAATGGQTDDGQPVAKSERAR